MGGNQEFLGWIVLSRPRDIYHALVLYIFRWMFVAGTNIAEERRDSSFISKRGGGGEILFLICLCVIKMCL